MNFSKAKTYSKSQVTIENFLPAMGQEVVTKSILSDLKESPKRISSMFLYNEAGSQLFEDITDLPEYYPAKTEIGILKKCANEIVSEFNDIDLVEIGSGDCSKISILLDAVTDTDLETIRYIPVDVSIDAIRKSADLLIQKYDGLAVHGIVADFMSQLDKIPDGRSRFFCFLGGTIGNFTPDDRLEFFRAVAKQMDEDDTLLVGADMQKPVDIIEKAYNDPRGVTAEFNINILNTVNDIVGSNIEPEQFEHIAFFNRDESRIEMHLKALNNMEIVAPSEEKPIAIKAGECIHTENSYKFSRAVIEQNVKEAGLEIQKINTDEKEWFSLIELRKAA